jgi:hypothetical protein
MQVCDLALRSHSSGSGIQTPIVHDIAHVRGRTSIDHGDLARLAEWRDRPFIVG